MRTTFMHTLNSRVLPLGLVLGLAVTACLMPGCRAARIAAARKALQQESGQPSGIAEVTQLEYESPDAALAALRSAVTTKDPVTLVEVLGPNWRSLQSGDAAERERQRLAFLARLEGSSFETVSGGAILLVGRPEDPDRFPFAVPLVKSSGGWQWDTDAGILEAQVRRIGRNELDTIEALGTIAAAQIAFRDQDIDGDGRPNFASALIGSDTRSDALYRPAGPVETALIGPALASADVTDGRAGAVPFHGYLYSMLPMQGPGAAGGAKDFRDTYRRYMNGFALLAYPAEYRVTGVTCFIVGPDGTVYEKDLGDDSEAAAAKVTAFDPTGWAKVE